MIFRRHSGRPDHFGRREFFRRSLGAAGWAGLIGSGLATGARAGASPAQRLGFSRPVRSPWFTPLPQSAIRCELCPRKCRIEPGRRGHCRVRENRGGEAVSLAYGNPSLVQIDPIERIPFFHVMPGARSLSVSTAGCPLDCRFCEVWDMALAAPEEVHAYDLPPRALIGHARSAGVQAVSFAFGEPVAFFEYMADACAAAQPAGLMRLMHSSGFISPEPLAAVAPYLDAVNIDLKSFDARFYREQTGGELQPVLDTLKTLKKNGVHIELTNLVIPTLNDDPGGIREMAQWVRAELGPATPLHFARFYPLHKLANLPPTPVQTLDRARESAQAAGLQHVYVARVTGHPGENTFCPGCGSKVIDRLGFVIEATRLTDGRCDGCGTPVAGVWNPRPPVSGGGGTSGPGRATARPDL